MASKIPADILAKLSAADKQYNFPAGTMLGLMTNEIGGQEDLYLNDLTRYHYAPNAKGERIAPTTGRISTAFGPFGILDSTAKDPGYGVKPLTDKTSFDEQLRFAAAYLNARSAKAHSLEAGLAGYGMGPEYAKKALAKTGQLPVGPELPAPETAPVVAQATAPATQVASGLVDAAVAPDKPLQGGMGEAWTAFLQKLPQSREAVYQPEDFSFGYTPMQASIAAPSGRVNFSPFGNWGRRRSMA